MSGTLWGHPFFISLEENLEEGRDTKCRVEEHIPTKERERIWSSGKNFERKLATSDRDLIQGRFLKKRVKGPLQSKRKESRTWSFRPRASGRKRVRKGATGTSSRKSGSRGKLTLKKKSQRRFKNNGSRGLVVVQKPKGHGSPLGDKQWELSSASGRN